MVTVTYTTAITPKETLEASVQVNKNIEITLPTLTNADNMFRGWLIEGNETLYNGAYKPVANVDFTAKWDTKYTFTAVYNDGTTENLVKVYGAGDVVDVENRFGQNIDLTDGLQRQPSMRVQNGRAEAKSTHP